MTIRSVLHYPDPKLRVHAEKVQAVDKEIQTLIDDMFETMYENHGCGLAAPQIGVSKQVIVIDMSPKSEKRDPGKIFVLINPEILEVSGEQVEEEGCLSVPGIYEKVKRFSCVKIKALDRKGQEFAVQAEHSYLAQCFQHEIDHLKGRLFIDYLSPLKLSRIKKKMRKQQEETY